jgi:hypothetical protein
MTTSTLAVSATGQESLSPWRHLAPIVTLAILAPLLAEVLFGSTGITKIWLLPGEIGCYGCAAVLIRAMVRTRRLNLAAMVLLGIAYSIAEECVILQTSLNPSIGITPVTQHGMLFGFNWPWMLFELGYESVFSIVLPIYLTQLIFPAHREEAWLGRRGMVITACLFLAGAVYAWFQWRSGALIVTGHPEHVASASNVLGALVAIALLTTIALGWGRLRSRPRTGSRVAPRPWLIALIALGLSLLGFVAFVLGDIPQVSALIPIVLYVVVYSAAAMLVRRWSQSRGWSDANTLGVIIGAYTLSFLLGFGAEGSLLFSPLDRIGKVVLDLGAVVLVVLLGLRIRRRRQARTASTPIVDSQFA